MQIVSRRRNLEMFIFESTSLTYFVTLFCINNDTLKNKQQQQKNSRNK